MIVSTEDTAAGQLWVYAGDKQDGGNRFDRAGLTNGELSVVHVTDGPNTDAGFRAAYGKGNPAPVGLASVDWNQPGAAQNADGAARGLSLTRIEDAAFDPAIPTTCTC